MSLFSTNAVPVISVITLVLVFSFIHSFLSRLVRRSSTISSRNESFRSSALSVSRVSMSRTSLYSLIISLIRFNIIFYAVSDMLLNNLFGSDTTVYFIVSIFSYMLTTEFLWFLKNKSKDSMNEVSTYLVFVFLTFGFIALSKGSINIAVETNILWYKFSEYFNNWEVFNIPVVLIPCITILILTEQRVINERKNLFLKTFDGYFDVITEKLIYFYLCLLMIKSIFGGVNDLSFLSIENEVPYLKILVLIYKYVAISMTVHLCLRFKSMSKNIRLRNQVSLTTMALVFINLCVVFYLRHVI